MDKHVIKQNSYTNPIDDLTFLDHLIFNFKLLFFIISTIPLISISFFLGNFVKPIQNYLSILFHKLLLWLLSVKVETEGHIDRAKDCNLFVSNHISYLDVPILGSNFPLRFVAKSEVASWNLFGFLAKLARTIFIKRNRHDTISQKNKIKKALLLKEQVLIFPEGTTSDGNRVLGFKSSLLSAVEKSPFSTADNKLDLKPSTRLPSDVVPSGKIKTCSFSNNAFLILFFWLIVSCLFLFIKIVLASLAKKPNKFQEATSDFATNLKGKFDPKIGTSK